MMYKAKEQAAYPQKEYTRFRPTKRAKPRYETRKTKEKTEPKEIPGPGNKLRIMVLGGLEEVGRNSTLIEYGDDIFIIDMGLQFPEEDMPGIDYIIPNYSYLRGKEKNVRGVVITHAHYDHIGAIPHVMEKIGNPIIYTGKLTAGIIRKRQDDYPGKPDLKIVEINENSTIKLGASFKIEFVSVNHNIPDTYAIVVHTPVGTIMHTGDFKIDRTPIASQPVNVQRIAALAEKGFLAVMADSTNATQPGHQISERDVERDLDKIFIEAKGRIIIGTFASLVTRIQQIITLAEKYNRKIYLQGRSMISNIDIAQKLGYMKFKPDTLIKQEDFHKVPPKQMIVIGTGAQGERTAVLMRIANDEHRDIVLAKGDTVIFSSSVIPGNERTVQKLKDTLTRKGAKVVHYQMMDVHAGGHARAEDLKYFITMTKPKYYIPIEANHYMLRANADLAYEVGMKEENVLVADNGQIMEFTKKTGKLLDKKVPADYVMVDGLGVSQTHDVVLRDRLMLANDGMFVVIVTIDAHTGKLLGNPDIISRGFIYLKEQPKLIEEARMRVKRILSDHDPKSPAFETAIKDKIKNSIGGFLYGKTKKRPMILPVLIEV